MNRKIILLVAGSTFVLASLALGSGYTGSVLYPTTAPSGSGSAAYPSYASAGQIVGSDANHALLWTTNGSVLDLNPTNLSGFTVSWANGTNGTQQVGTGYGSGGPNAGHALLWTGTAASAVDLNPRGFTYSVADGTSGTQQVGYGWGNGTPVSAYEQALLWTGSAASAVNLNPTNLSEISQSEAFGTSGNQQVGRGWYGNGLGGYRALLWNGTAASAVDLNESQVLVRGYLSSFVGSEALGTSGTQQVGDETQFSSGYRNATLWTGTADSAVDLNPTNLSGITNSYAYGTNGTQQVGFGYGSGTGNEDHALLWSGTADSAVDLQSLLPSTGTWSYSYADTIDSFGDIYGIADGTFDNLTDTFAVEWSPVPEPATESLLLVGGAGILMRRRRKQLGRLPCLENFSQTRD